MSELFELAITSVADDKASSINIFNVRTGTYLGSYRGGGHCPPHGLAVEGGHIIACENLKPVLHSWSLNKQICELNRLICPGRVSALTVSPDAVFIAVGIGEKLCLYQVSSGRLIAVGTRHFQPIVAIKFSNDGTLLASGGEDGAVAIWNIGTMVTKYNSEPAHTFSEHSLPVTDLIFTSGSLRSRIISVSGDQTCKVYDIMTKTSLLSLVFNARLTSLALRPNETEIYVGDFEGHIHKITLCNPPRTQEYQCSETTSKFLGHKKSVTCLSCSMDGCFLMSGSNDETVKIWDIFSHQCLRTIPQKGPVTNAFFIFPPPDMFSQQFIPSVKLHNFVTTSSSEGPPDDFIEVITTNDLNFNLICFKKENIHEKNEEGNNNSNSTLERKLKKLKQTNESIFKFALTFLLEKPPKQTLAPNNSFSNDKNYINKESSSTSKKVGFKKHKMILARKLKQKRKNNFTVEDIA